MAKIGTQEDRVTTAIKGKFEGSHNENMIHHNRSAGWLFLMHLTQ